MLRSLDTAGSTGCRRVQISNGSSWWMISFVPVLRCVEVTTIDSGLLCRQRRSDSLVCSWRIHSMSRGR